MYKNTIESGPVIFEASFIQIGKYEVIPTENVSISETKLQIAFRNAADSQSENVTYSVKLKDLVKIVCHLESNATLMFHAMGQHLKEIQTKLSTNDSSLFDTSSQWIIVQTSALTNMDQKEIRQMFMIYNFDEISFDDMEKFCKYIIANKKTEQKKQKSTKPADIILNYPPNATRSAISISVQDYECLGCDEYLNDRIIEFYIEYLQLEVLSAEQRAKTHMFNTFFYRAFTDRPPRGAIKTERLTPAQERHARVKKWTRNVNIFDKDFIIVPINSGAHWFLAIVCFPLLKTPVYMHSGEVAKEKKRGLGLTSKRRKRKIKPDDDKHENLETDVSTDISLTAIKRPCILVFDSMGSGSSNVIDIIREYLNCEYAAKNIDPVDFKFDSKNMPGQSIHVPHQPNTADCGLFLLQNIEQFFKKPIESYELPIEGLDDWYETEIATRKRKDIAELIKNLMHTHNNNFPLQNLPKIELPEYKCHSIV